MSFINNLPDDYYQTTLINSFTEHEKSNINYNLPIYQRNPRVNCKLSLNLLNIL
jgi:hypothetical protein